MNVLVISYYAAWTSSVGSRRMTGLVRALSAAGYTVTVIGARSPNGDSIAFGDEVAYVETPTRDRVLSARSVSRHLVRTTPSSHDAALGDVPASAPATRRPAGRLLDIAASRVRPWVAYPDTMWEWTWAAQRAGRRLPVPPDVIVASAPPMAALHAAAGLADHFGVPWVADMRDLWSGDPYRVVPAPLRSLDHRLERRVLRSAAAITTVAEPLADELRDIVPDVPVTAIRNGFDDRWLRLGDDPPTTPPRVVYTGTLTSNTGRDLGAFCDAVELAMRRLAHPLWFDIYGPVVPSLRAAVESRTAGAAIRFLGTVPASEARAAQHHATALLSLGWEDPRDYHKCPAKLFEYAAARRPILHLGSAVTLGTNLIRDHALGAVVAPTDTRRIVDTISGFVSGRWMPPSPAALEPLGQTAMTREFERVIGSVAD